MQNKLYISLLLATALTLSSCAPVVIGGVAGAGAVALQERSVGDAVDDATIWTKINSEMMKDDSDILIDVSLTVTEGRVLLTGEVDDADARAKVVQIAWSQRGVKEVINEIVIRDMGHKYPLINYSKDTWITTQVKAKLLAEREIASVNYTVDTVISVVYIMGIAQSKHELDKVNYLAGTVKYVKKVVNHARLKNSLKRDVNKAYGE